jgi:hypothetical protein
MNVWNVPLVGMYVPKMQFNSFGQREERAIEVIGDKKQPSLICIKK